MAVLAQLATIFQQVTTTTQIHQTTKAPTTPIKYTAFPRVIKNTSKNKVTTTKMHATTPTITKKCKITSQMVRT